jgi:hypothetical protein
MTVPSAKPEATTRGRDFDPISASCLAIWSASNGGPNRSVTTRHPNRVTLPMNSNSLIKDNTFLTRASYFGAESNAWPSTETPPPAGLLSNWISIGTAITPAAGSPFDQGYSRENRKGSEERLANGDEPVSRIGFLRRFPQRTDGRLLLKCWLALVLSTDRHHSTGSSPSRRQTLLISTFRRRHALSGCD